MATYEQKDNIIDGMVDGNQDNTETLASWHNLLGGSNGTPLELSIYRGNLSEGAQSAARAAWKLWGNVSGLHFNVVDDEDDANIIFAYEDFSDSDSFEEDWYGASYFAPSSKDLLRDPNYQSTVYLNTLKGVEHFENALNEPRFFRVFVHELGHALGLEHPFDPKDGDTAPIDDNSLYSIMAKAYPEGYPVGPDDNARLPNETPMVWDILAIQKLYGANASYNQGNTSYSWSADSTHYLAIWDASGNDTIDVSNQSGTAFIDLNEGDYGGGEVKIKEEIGAIVGEHIGV